MTSDFTSRGMAGGKGRRPGGLRLAWAVTLAAVAAEVAVWVLGAFVVAPTSLDELTAFAGREEAVARLVVSAGVLALLLAAWVAVALWMRAGRGWARMVLTAVGAGLLLFRLSDFSMDGMGGVGPAWWVACNALPDLLAAAAVVPMWLPGSRTHARPAA
ncbi:hypothetical protein [Streptomyces sp. NPDC047981]|uniref:hypothetical protein n=1 Tax=Streptomyces sp. NPDC047981 TaxID=3154610 RepID=UPI003444923B